MYARLGQNWTFFEIDQLVERVARRYFTYLRNAAVPPSVVIGDGRRSLVSVPEGSLDILVLDAFSSDAIPVHLLTREALRLKPQGILAVHISNRFVDLSRPLSGIARAEGLCGLDQLDPGSAATSNSASRQLSRWVILGKSCAALSSFSGDSRWAPLNPSGGAPVWSDERQDLLTVIQWSAVLTGATR